MEEKIVTISENTLLFLLDKVMPEFKEECTKIVENLLKNTKEG